MMLVQIYSLLLLPMAEDLVVTLSSYKTVSGFEQAWLQPGVQGWHLHCFWYLLGCSSMMIYTR